MVQRDPAAYIREWRRTANGRASLLAQKRRDQAKRAAIRALIDRHQDEYEALFTAHLMRIEDEARTASD
jgi:hypothetical protein